MHLEELYSALDYVDHSRDKRRRMAQMVQHQPRLMGHLVHIAFLVNDPISSKACWILEFLAKSKLSSIYPYLDMFTQDLNKVKFDSSVRPMAKICECLITAYFSKTPNDSQTALNGRHLKLMAAANFDWLIGNHKVATKAYAMTCLLLLGKKYPWIYGDLKPILQQGYINGSAAYKARARKTLAKLK